MIVSGHEAEHIGRNLQELPTIICPYAVTILSLPAVNRSFSAGPTSRGETSIGRRKSWHSITETMTTRRITFRRSWGMRRSRTVRSADPTATTAEKCLAGQVGSPHWNLQRGSQQALTTILIRAGPVCGWKGPAPSWSQFEITKLQVLHATTRPQLDLQISSARSGRERRGCTCLQKTFPGFPPHGC